MDREISAHLLKLRRTHPFFATLSMFARYRFVGRVKQFETDGNHIFINPTYFRGLQDKEKTGVLLHVTLHTALLHTTRIGIRNTTVWNIASDIVVNNMILEAGSFDAPPQTAKETKYTGLSVEEVYEKLMHLHNESEAVRNAALARPDTNRGKSATPSQAQIQAVLDQLYPSLKDLAYPDTANDLPKTASGKNQTAHYWQNAFRKAEVAVKYGSQQQGLLPAGLRREIDQLMAPQLDWRWILWNFTVRTPSDFTGFDRRFVYRGLYLDKLESDSLTILVAVDTSGSIDQEELTQFLSELSAIQNAYHFIRISLYYVDADIYGPYPLTPDITTSLPMGGGGTDFTVFFARLEEDHLASEYDLVIYFTDGFGSFPDKPPSTETLWVVTSGGLDSDRFPFGLVTRLSG